MENLYGKLNSTDIENIISYIENCVGEFDTSLSHILRFWNNNKQNLFKRLGGNLIVSKSIEIGQTDHELGQKISDFMNSQQYRDFNLYIRSYYEKPRKQEYRREYTPYWFRNNYISEEETSNIILNGYYYIQNLLDYTRLKKNELNKDVEIYLVDKTLKFPKGMSAMRALGKIARAIDCPTEIFENFRNAHSTCTQLKSRKGTLHLSIHPLDYMTMSDNAHDWRSCMSWADEGCYRQGTVEMMNSESVIVAYITTDREMELPNGRHWNSKMWRTLIVSTDDFATTIKGYPYQCKEFAAEALALLSEVSGDYIPDVTKWEWSNRGDCIDGTYLGDSNSTIYFTTEERNMYNDFGGSKHYLVWSPNAPAAYNYGDYFYSGESECMLCGEEMEWEEEEEECLHCGCETPVRCSCCGRRISREERSTHLFSGTYYCDNCIEKNTKIDIFDGRRYGNSDFVDILVIDQDYKHYEYGAFKHGGYDYSILKSRLSFRKDGFGAAYPRYVYPQDLTQEAWKTLLDHNIISITAYNKFAATPIEYNF